MYLPFGKLKKCIVFIGPPCMNQTDAVDDEVEDLKRLLTQHATFKQNVSTIFFRNYGFFEAEIN